MASPSRLVVVGASAGGVEALLEFVGALEAGFAAPIAVVLHIAPQGTSVLAGILERSGALPAVTAEDGVALEPGRIHVAPSDHHLVCEDGVVRTPRGPRENGHRPAVDPLFRSAAQLVGPGAIAVVLSGARDDGTLGAGAIKGAGGKVFAQDPADALYPDMPRNVIAHVETDGTGTPTELARSVTAELDIPPPRGGLHMVPDTDPSGLPDVRPGQSGASGFTCPECGGAIYEDRDTGVLRFACHEKHVYSAESMIDEQNREAENALWTAVRLLEERAALLRQIARRFPDSQSVRTRLEGNAVEAETNAELIRARVLEQQRGTAA